MSERLLVSTLQASRIAPVLNICPTDDRFYQWLSEAENLMLNQGRFFGSVVEAQFCVGADNCITWPRQVQAVEQVAINGQPLDSFNGWYGFTRLLANLRPCTGCSTGSNGSGAGFGPGYGCSHLQHRLKEGTVASFATTLGENKVLRTYPSGASDVGKKMIYQGRDSNGIWVRTEIDGVVQDGEEVTLALPFVDTVTVWGPGSPVAVVKEVTDRRVLLYSYDTDTTEERALGDYEAGETRPSYRQSHVPGLACVRNCGCSTTSDAERRTTVSALVSLQHVPLTSPGDWLVLQNLSAYKAAMIAVKAWEEGDEAKGNFHFYGTQAGARNGRGVTRVVNRGGAIPLLQAELRKNTSDRTSAYVYIDETWKFPRQMAGFR